MKIVTGVILLGFLFPVDIHSQNLKDEAINLAKSTNTENFFSNMSILASDSLEGRETGSVGYRRAADYIVQEIEKLGLLKGGSEGTYFQPVAFETRKIDKESVRFSVRLENNSIEGEFGNDITIFPSIRASEVIMNENLVFAAYGLDIPELGINDLRGIDVTGKIVIISMDVPARIDKSKYYEVLNPIERIKLIEKRGAKGIIIFTNRTIFQNIIFKAFHGFFREPYFDFKETDISNLMIGNGRDVIVFSKKDFIEKVFKMNGLKFKETIKKMEKGKNVSVDLKSTLHLRYLLVNENVNCKNIVAILPGSDPVLKSEYVVLSAHLDHLGIGKSVKNDSIYNGAWDNASGCATLLSVAETYTKLSVAPKRSVIFLWVTAEEKGLLGSAYFAQKPTVERDKIKADMSLDMAGGIFDFNDIVPMGYKMSNLSDAIDFTTRALNIRSDTLSSMENEYFERSDHFSFVSEGIPALLIFGGTNAVDPKIDGEKAYKTWEKRIYHSPSDDMKQEFSKLAFLKGIQINFLASWFIANELKEVAWKSSSEQYKKYILK